MDLSKIIEFIKSSGGRYIITQNGQEKIVVMTAKDYHNLLAGNNHNQETGFGPKVPGKGFVDQINKKLEGLPFGEEVTHTIKEEMGQAEESDDEPIYFEEIPEEEEIDNPDLTVPF